MTRFAESGLAIEAFCRRESISPSSCYRWRSLCNEPSAREVAPRSPLRATGSAAAFVELGRLPAAHDFDRSGFCVWGKRLETGRFISDWRNVRSREMNWTALKLLLAGIEPGRPRQNLQKSRN
ncbi:MAG: IS66 family insertion sequence element accessory protein TnpB [Gammaproteobacteria bacterium]|nr:IS66 family insertion sequence element accessory protein TnpB [Gammaproteobacteria bacterium]